MTEKELHKLLAKGEGITLECKRSGDGLPGSLWETYSAFANTNGGIVLLGISEDHAEKSRSRRFTITGVENADKVRKDLWNIVNSKEKVNVNLLHDEDVQIVNVDGRDVVVVKVPRAGYNMRPVYINNNIFRGTFRRNHEGDYRCTEQMVRMMVRDAYDDGNDRLFLEHYTMDDIDIPTLKSYRVMFMTENPDHVWNALDHKEFMIKLGGYVTNRNLLIPKSTTNR